MTKITVITPVFNGEKYLQECVESVAKSVSFDKLEMEQIIVDDASTDGTARVLEQLDYGFIKKYRLAKNSGPAAARNYALKKTDSDYIFCLDADNILLQTALLRLWEASRNQSADWVYGDFLRINAAREYLIGQDYYGWDFKDAKEVLTAMYKGEHFFQGNCLMKRKLFDQVGGYDESMRLAEDMDLYTRFLLAGHRPHYLPGPLYLHRFHGDNLSAKYLTDKSLHERDVRELSAKYRRQLEKVLTAE